MSRGALTRALTATAVIVAGTTLGVAWYYADQVHAGALRVDNTPPALDLRVLEVGEGLITLGPAKGGDRAGDWTRDGLWGLEFEGGYGRVGRILDRHQTSVTREFLPLDGMPRPGAPARLDSFVFAGDPRSARGVEYGDVAVPGPLGPLPAWYIPGSRSTWAVFVHGKGADRRESLRLLPTLAAEGLPVLVISYRNDAGTARDGNYAYGRHEWPDLEAAVRYALDRGAGGVVLIGYSMGAGVVMAFLEGSPLASVARGVIFDAPMLDLGAVLDSRAKQRGLPRPITLLAKWLTGVRFGVDWDSLDYLRRADTLRQPVLLFHGEDDDVVPIAISDRLAAARPDIVTYIRVPGAGHVRSWNLGPEAYERTVRDFLAGLGR